MGDLITIARSLLPVPIVTRKSYNKSSIAIPRVGQYREIFRSRLSTSVSSLPSVGPIRSVLNGIFPCIALPVMQ